ncbi:MAG: hypothetical protein IPJ27_05250 [Candidatus Accumulibacter sp.]|uniref:Uncharacterized protein n=1 Tax=Candidatus Accumulibacter proximus TaxID=2954385 RepID=A0A935PVP9_9PROT|nr:hypothetical protein [Candidatus Accumulibacter proximus]
MLRDPLDTAAIDQLDKLGLPPDTHKVALASALLWTFRSQTEIHRLLGLTGLKASTGKPFTFSDVKNAVQELARRQLLLDDPARPAAFQLPDALRAPLYRQLLETSRGNQLVQLICELDHFDPSRSRYYWGTGSIPTTIAYVRAKFFLGAPAAELANIRNQVSQFIGWDGILINGVLLGFDGQSFERIDALERWHLASQAAASVCLYWGEPYLPVVDWAFAQLQQRPAELSESLRLGLADLALQRADAGLLEAALAGPRRRRGCRHAGSDAGARRPVGGRTGGLRSGVQAAQERDRRHQALPCRQRHLVLPAVAACPGNAQPPAVGTQVLRRRGRPA